MTDFSNDPLDDTPSSGSTRATPPPRRRPPEDDYPPVSARPAIPRASRTPPTRSAPIPPEQSTQRGNAVNVTRDRRRTKAKQSRPPRQPIDKSRSGLYLPWWSLIIMIAFVGCAAVGALIAVSSLENNAAPLAQTPIVVVITSTFTVGPPASETPIPLRATLTPSPQLPTIPPTITLPPGNFAIGQTIMVVGVGPSGLNVRSAPGLDSAVKFLAQDGESYYLKDGPQTASNDEWWYIQDSVDTNKGGWASRRFLTVPIPTPIQAVPTPSATAAH